MDEIRVSEIGLDSEGNLVLATCEVVDPGRADIERRYRIPRTPREARVSVEEWRVYGPSDRRRESELKVNVDQIPSPAVAEAYEWVMAQLARVPRPRAEVVAILTVHADMLDELKTRIETKTNATATENCETNPPSP